MAHTKQQGGSNRHVRRVGKRLGLKVFGGEAVKSGNIIVRQKGTKFHSGTNTDLGKDFTIFATSAGEVYYKKMTGSHRGQSEVQVRPFGTVTAVKAAKGEKGIKTVKVKQVKEVLPSKKAVKTAARKVADKKKAEKTLLAK